MYKEAFKNTAIYRNYFDQINENRNSIFDLIKQDSNLQKHWESYQTKYSYANDIDWNEVIESLQFIIKL